MMKLFPPALALFGAALIAGSTAAADIGPKVGDEAKDFELTDLAGEKVKLTN